MTKIYAIALSLPTAISKCSPSLRLPKHIAAIPLFRYYYDMKNSASKTIQRSRLGSWGGSIALRLPRAAAEALAMREGTTVAISVEGNALVIRSDRPSFTLAEMVAAARGLTPPDLLDDGPTGSEQI